MEFNEYQKEAKRTLFGNEQVLTNITLGVANEAGQVVDLVQRYTFQGRSMDKERLTHELGDTLWYLSQIAEWANIDFEDVAKQNIKELNDRYPDPQHAKWE